jgi:PAS domain S-box-containing protein
LAGFASGRAGILLGLAAFFGCVHRAPAADAPALAATAVITNFDEALRLPLAEAGRGRAVNALVTVAYCHPQWGMLFVEGEETGGYLSIKPETPELRPGDVVEVEGRTLASHGYPEVGVERLRPTGRRRSLTPRNSSLEDIASGRAAGQWVEIEGLVLAAYGKDGRTMLRLKAGATNLPVVVLRGSPDQARRWVGRQTKVAGVVSAQFDSRGRITETMILAQEEEQARPTNLADTGWLDLPITPVSRLRTPAPGQPSELVHLQGRLERLQADSVAWVGDGATSIRLQCLFKPDARIESEVEALGYLVRSSGQLFLRDAAVFPVTASAEPESETPSEVLASTNSLPLVESARAVRRLDREQAARGFPARLTGVATFSDPAWGLLFVQDETGAVFVKPLPGQKAPRSGQRVLVMGRTAPGAFAPMVGQASLSILGDGEMPAPARPELGDLLAGRFDCRWIEIGGVVQSFSEDGGRSTLSVRTAEGRLSAFLAPSIPPIEAARLVEARVTLRGAAGVGLDRGGLPSRVFVYVPDLSSVHVDEPPPADLFSSAPVRIGDLLRHRPEEDAARRVKVAGVVTSVFPDGMVTLQDESGGMMARPDTGLARPRLGNPVEVAGFPATRDFSVTLEDSRLRILGPGRELEATNTTPEAILRGARAWELVRIDARLMEDAFFRPGERLVLQSGAVVFEASLSPSLDIEDAEPLLAGSYLSVTGVCRPLGAPGSRPTSFNILLRRPKDVRVLAWPAWWNLRRLFIALAGVAGVSVIALAWGLLLAKKNRQLRESEERVRIILNNVHAGILVVDPATQEVLDANPEALALAKRDRGEVVGLGSYIIIPSAGQGVGPVAPPGRGEAFEDTLERSDGVMVPILRTLVRIELGGRAVLLESFVDITERKRAQTELERAKLAAEAASEAKSRFLAIMSHEIRTPLSGVAAVLHLLQSDDLTARQRRWIEMAENSAGTLRRVINDILDFSKIEAGKMDLRFAPASLPSVVNSTAALFAHKAAEKGLAWSVWVDPALPEMALLDCNRLSQVLGNLLGNAVKFTDSGSVSLRVERRASGSAEGAVFEARFEVADTGSGLRPEQLGILFKPFSQVGDRATHRQGGTGLGLVICKQLVELMRGKIGLRSEPGKGSVFWFELPFEIKLAAPQANDAGAAGSESIAGQGARSRSPSPEARRVLLADDNEINQELAREIVRMAGCECDCVANGLDAVRAVNQGRYDVVIMDCMMPDLDGYGATRAIRAEEARQAAAGGAPRRVPIIALTANAMEGDREICLAAGMDDYLPKPLNPGRLTQVLRHWLAVIRPDARPPEAAGESSGFGDTGPEGPGGRAG